MLASRFVLAAVLATATFAAVAAGNVKVGHVSALTGTYAFVGKPVANGVAMAAEELNQARYFGDAQLELINADNASDRGQAVTLFTRMVSRDQVKMVMGPISSQEALAVAPVANSMQAPMITVAYSPDVLKAGPWSFKASSVQEAAMLAIAKYAVEKVGCKNMYLISIRDNEGYVRQKNWFRDAVKATGANVIADESILSSDSDFTALATKTAGAKPDCLYVDAPPEQAANIIIQLRQAGLSDGAKLFSSNTVASPRFMAAGGKAVDGTYFIADYVPNGANALAKNFAANYQRKFGTAPDNWAAMGYTMMMVSAKAIKDAGGAEATRDQVRAALGKIRDMQVVIGQGTYSMDAERVPQYGAVILQFKGGVAVPVN